MSDLCVVCRQSDHATDCVFAQRDALYDSLSSAEKELADLRASLKAPADRFDPTTLCASKGHGTYDDCCCAAMRNALPALLAAAEERDRLRERLDYAKERLALARCSFCEAEMQRADAAAHMLSCDKHPLSALLELVSISACPDCGGDYRRQRNGGPCRYVWHDRKEALAGKAGAK